MKELGFFNLTNYLSQECLDFYNENGYFILRDFLDKEKDLYPIQKYINYLIKSQLNELGEESTSLDDSKIDIEGFLKLCKIDRSKGGKIYDACRHLYPLQKISLKDEFINLAKFLMKTDYVNVIPYTPIRIDLKGEEKYLFPWHQDYPYIQGSEDGIVLWFPFHDVLKGSGALEVIPKSHRNGIQKVYLKDPDNKNKNGARTVDIAHEEKFDAMEKVTAEILYGDILVFSTLLIHKSTVIETANSKWATQIRYANFSDKRAIKRGWPKGMLEGNHFEYDHSEYIENLN
ncbi:MAG: phytanoyl-CoA dioxygenase family protein [Candidatus Sericytochromatia bacterium]